MSEGRIDMVLAGDGCLEVTLDRPGTGNALDAAMTRTLGAVFAAPDPGARFILLRGAGGAFCAGRDSPMPLPGARIAAEDIRARVAEPVLDFYETVRSVPLPVIAAVQGPAHGVGFALAALADIVLADASAEFRVPEMDRDIPPLLVAYALADRLPRRSVARALLGREAFDAEGAVALGLATEAVGAAEDLAARIAFWRGQLARNSRTTLGAVKRFLTAAPEMGFSARREHAAAAISAAVSERFLPPQKGEPA